MSGSPIPGGAALDLEGIDAEAAQRVRAPGPVRSLHFRSNVRATRQVQSSELPPLDPVRGYSLAVNRRRVGHQHDPSVAAQHIERRARFDEMRVYLL